MIFKKDTAEGIRAGKITVAFRQWKKPTVKAGGNLRSMAGYLAIEKVDPIHERDITAADAKKAGYPSLDALLADLKHFGQGKAGQLYRVQFRLGGVDPRTTLRESAELSETDVADILKKLDRMDAASDNGPWTRQYLRLIAKRPNTLAETLAKSIGMEKFPFKARVARLKGLGLTISRRPAPGYTLSPRGEALLKKLEKK